MTNTIIKANKILFIFLLLNILIYYTINKYVEQSKAKTTGGVIKGPAEKGLSPIE
jgi:hypothetical protein